MSDAKMDPPTSSAGTAIGDSETKLQTWPMEGRANQDRRVPHNTPPFGNTIIVAAVQRTQPAPPVLDEVVEITRGVNAKIKWEQNGTGDVKYEVCWWSDETDQRFDFTNSRNHIITKLKPGMTYCAKVTQINEAQSEASCSSNTITFDTGPATPVDLQVENFESSPHDSIMVFFKDTNKGRQVTHEVIVEAVTEDSAPIVKSTSNRKVLVPHLKPGVSYSIAVRTVQGEDEKSDLLYYDAPVMTYPAVPQGLVLVLEDGILKFSWRDLAIKPLRYEVHLEINGVVNVTEVKEARFVIRDVKLSTMYRFRVAAVNKAGCGYLSEEKSYQTDPSPPVNVCVQRNPMSPMSSFIVNYEDQDSLKKHYKIVATNLDGEIISHTQSDTHAAVLNDLPAGCPHFIYVVAVYRDLESQKTYCTRNVIF